MDVLENFIVFFEIFRVYMLCLFKSLYFYFEDMNIMYGCFRIYYYIKINWYYFKDRYNYFIFLNFNL